MRKKTSGSAVGVFVVIGLVMNLAIFGMAPATANPIKNGDPCSPVGATFKQSGTTFTCTKSADGGVWKAKKKASAKPTAEASFVMPKVVGMNLQLAQDLLQSKGSYILDRNWKVCAQSPSAGKRVSASTMVTLSSVKLSESC